MTLAILQSSGISPVLHSVSQMIDSWAVNAHFWLVSRSFSSTRTPKSFSAGLLSRSSSPTLKRAFFSYGADAWGIAPPNCAQKSFS